MSSHVSCPRSRCWPAGEVADARFFRRAADPDPARRTLALEDWRSLGASAPTKAATGCADPDTEVVQAAIRLLPQSTDPAFSESLMALANHPDWRFAEAASCACWRCSHRSARATTAGTCHRASLRSCSDRRSVGQKASPAALDDLEVATRNADAHTRTLALQRLAEKSPDRARRHIEHLVADPHIWVRLHAAAVAAQCADAALAPSLKIAADTEKDEAIRLYLLDALARARPASARCPAGCESCCAGPEHHIPLWPRPRRAEYAVPGLLRSKREGRRRGQDRTCRGKSVSRALQQNHPEPRPSCVVPRMARRMLARDRRRAFGRAPVVGWRGPGRRNHVLRKIHRPWPNGWRLFCREAGLDPLRIAGKLENLSERENKPGCTGSSSFSVEGFNTLYDFIKLRYGKLRPGFVVCTFMPDQNGPCDFDRMWKFDIGAGYYYQVNNRYRYAQIRRFKTLWPDRPVLWLVNGVSTNSNGGGGVKYTAKMPTTPLTPTTIQPYADTICAWLAGANTGNFTGYLFMDKNMKDGMNASGLYVFIEDLHPGSSSLQRGITLAFNGVEELYRTRAAIKELKPDIQIGKTGPADNTTLDEPKAKTKDRFSLQVEAEMKQMETGFLLDAKQDKLRPAAHRSSLPGAAHTVLLVGDITASKGAASAERLRFSRLHRKAQRPGTFILSSHCCCQFRQSIAARRGHHQRDCLVEKPAGVALYPGFSFDAEACHSE